MLAMFHHFQFQPLPEPRREEESMQKERANISKLVWLRCDLCVDEVLEGMGVLFHWKLFTYCCEYYPWKLSET